MRPVEHRPSQLVHRCLVCHSSTGLASDMLESRVADDLPLNAA